MAAQIGIPEAAWTFLSDMVDNCYGMNDSPKEVLILANKDGLYGGDNYVDEEAISWVSTAFTSRGHHVSVLWIDDPQSLHNWRYNPLVKKAIEGVDLFVNTTFDLAVEEIADYRGHIENSHIDDPTRPGNPFFPLIPDKQSTHDFDTGTWMIRLFPVTSAMMMTDWARTPYELVNWVRHISSEPFMKLEVPTKFVMTDPNGTCLEGYTVNPTKREGVPGMPYDSWRKDSSHYLPCPEWVHPPINCTHVNGDLYFHAMLSWWSRYIGIAPEWDKDIHIAVKDSKMVAIDGCKEADKLYHFLKEMETKVGEKIWLFDTFHFGIHPNGRIEKYQCPNELYRRNVEHMDCSNVHWHIGSAGGRQGYNFYPHITGDIRECTLTVGEDKVYDNGWLCCQDDPRLKEIMKKYPGRPGIPVNPNLLKAR